MKKQLILLLALFITPLAAATREPELSPKIQSYIQTIESRKDGLQGGAIAILHKGKVVYKTTFGHQRGKSGRINSSTLFPLASVSKPVAATAIALLVDKGVLDFDDKFTLPVMKNPISLTNILSHSTGYHYRGNVEIEKGFSRQKMLNELKRQQPHCKPGQCYFYSNATYSLVEEGLNKKNLSFQSAISNLQKTLDTDGIQIVPLTPNADVAFPHIKVKPKRGKSYIKPLPFPPYYPKATPAGGGVFASIDGMIELYRLNFGYRPDLISNNTLKMMHTPIIANRDNEKWRCLHFKKRAIESYYGRGWRILKAKHSPGKDLILHSGLIAGAVSFIGYIPSEEVGIIIMINQNTKEAYELGFGFWRLHLKG